MGLEGTQSYSGAGGTGGPWRTQGSEWRQRGSSEAADCELAIGGAGWDHAQRPGGTRKQWPIFDSESST